MNAINSSMDSAFGQNWLYIIVWIVLSLFIILILLWWGSKGYDNQNWSIQDNNPKIIASFALFIVVILVVSLTITASLKQNDQFNSNKTMQQSMLSVSIINLIVLIVILRQITK